MIPARRLLVPTIVALATILSAQVAPVLADDQGVTIQDFAFQPRTVTVGVGDSVTWTNQDGVGHTATADDGSFDTDTIAAGSSASVTFDSAGSFPYHCEIHPSMTGTVVVEAAGGGATASPTGGATQPPTDTRPATGRAATPFFVLLFGAAAGLFLAIRSQRFQR